MDRWLSPRAEGLRPQGLKIPITSKVVPMTLQSRLQFLADTAVVSEAEMKAFIKARGWHTWYNEDYWVHRRYERAGADYTNWGMSLEKAYKAEIALYQGKDTPAAQIKSERPTKRIRSQTELRAIRGYYARKKAA